MNSKLNFLLDAYRILGTSLPFWTQGQGSNLSYKDQDHDRMWIKPSGYRLDQVHRKEDLVELDLHQLAVNWSDIDENQYSKIIREAKVVETPMRPSMETGFHAVLAGNFVFHFHSIVSLCMGVHKDARAWLEKRWKSGSIHFMEYSTPGLDLTNELSRHRNGSLFILKGHGIILSGDEPAFLNEWLEIEKEWVREFYNLEWPLKNSFSELFQRYSQGHFKVLFPDMAVFLTSLDKLLIDIAPMRKFPPDAIEAHQNIAELWVATQMLLDFEPDFPELDDSEIQKITNLPTEQYRKMRS